MTSLRRSNPRGPVASWLWVLSLGAAACIGPSRFDHPDCDPVDEAQVVCPVRPVDLPAGRTELRVLVFTADGMSPSLGAIRSALDRLGVAYDVLEAGTQPLTAARLSTASASCAYRGVILDVSGLSMLDANEYVSTLSDEEWQLLADFEVRCDAREVIWYAYPDADLGLALRAERDDVTPVNARLTSEGAVAFPYLRPEANLLFQGAYAYLAQVSDPATTTPLVVTEQGDALVSVHRRPDGREVLAMTVDSSDVSIHGKLLEHGVLSWLMRGLFVGQRRVYLSAQIDDLFIPNYLWEPGGGQGQTTYRMSAADLDGLAEWQAGLAARLPAGSRFATTLALNGVGTTSLYPDTALEAAALAHAADFLWVNHTWDHTNMDEMTDFDAKSEIERNVAYATDHDLPGFDRSAAVTPEVSGLDNAYAVQGMLAAGVRFVVSDTSITPELRPNNPGTNPSHNVGRANPHGACLYQVPRYPTEIYVSCSTIAEEVDRFNVINRGDRGRDLTYAEILAEEGEWAFRHLLNGDINPFMFHQSNLRTWQQDGPHSLYSDWIDATVSRYTAIVNLPILSLSLADIGRAMQARGALERCDPRATLVTRDGVSSLELQVTGKCTVPVTGLDAPKAGPVESYGGVPTTSVKLDRCGTTTIRLPGQVQ